MAGTLRGRLARTLGLAAVASVALTALITFGLVRRFAQDNAMRELSAHAGALAREGVPTPLTELRPLRRVLAASGDLIALVGPRGRVSSDDPAAREVAESIDLGPVLSGSRTQGTVKTSGGEYAYVAVPIERPRGENSAIVLSRPVGLARDVWQPVLTRVVSAALLAAALAVAGSALLARRLTDPIRRVADATSGVASGDLQSRVPVTGDAEIAHLATRFNAMADSLAEARRREHEFLATISHELRTPITAIRGYAEAIADGAVTGTGLDEAVAVITDEAGRLERLVEDVMDLARLGAKEFRLEPVEVDLAETLRETARAHYGRAVEREVTLESAAGGPLVATTDPARVRQVLSNLVENALRVTPGGGVVRLDAASGEGTVRLSVTDTGPGIAAADLPHVFERSYLWSRSRETREVSTGLGLAIVRELAGALGGRVEATSEPGRGSTFTLVLPVEPHASGTD